MGLLVCNSAQVKCSFGAAPAALIVLPISRVIVSNQPAATITDSAPMMNSPTFGMCMTLTNPAVAAATSAALGVFTPAPCIPVTVPWAPGSATVLIGGKPALNNSSTCSCTWGGVITVVMPGQTQTQVP